MNEFDLFIVTRKKKKPEQKLISSSIIQHFFPREMKGHSNRYLHNNTLMNVCTQFSHFANLRLGILNSFQRPYSLCAVKYVVLCPNNAGG